MKERMNCSSAGRLNGCFGFGGSGTVAHLDEVVASGCRGSSRSEWIYHPENQVTYVLWNRQLSVSNQISWTCICIASLRFRTAIRRQTLEHLLPFKNFLYPMCRALAVGWNHSQ